MTRGGAGASVHMWDQARAALARVFGPVQVRQLGLDAPDLPSAGRASEATGWPIPGAGRLENGWLPAADTRVWQPLAASRESGNVDAAVLLCTVSGSAVPHLFQDGVHGGETNAFPVEVRAVDMGRGMGGAGTVLPLSVALSGGQPLLLPIALPMPPVRAVFVAPTGGGSAVLQSAGRSGVPAFRAPRTWSHLARMTRVPLLFRRAVLPADADIGERFAAERQSLASACGAAVEEVKLLASFPHVPLALVQQMAVTPDGECLRLWLRPEALASGAGWTTPRVTIVLGRQRLTGETVRAVLPESRSTGRKQ